MERELDVFVARSGESTLVGRLWARVRGARESASFEYAESWVRDRRAFSVDPELPLGRGQFHTERALFNAFTDPAPDRWGQTLLRRNERRRAVLEKRTPRTLRAIDFLTLVDDETRLGALRFREPGATAFLTEGSTIPPIVQLPRLLRAAAAVLADSDTDDDLVLLLAPGTSLGGARPKASVRDHGGRLAVAKFPARNDEWPLTRWEAATLNMAKVAGVIVPAVRLAKISGKAVIVVERFDRDGAARIPYMSALTALNANDGEVRSYLELAETLRASGGAPRVDLLELWRRIAFNVLVSNTDDHLRNHGFLLGDQGWRLSPAFDLNPAPVDVRPRVHALALDEHDQTASLDTVRRIAPIFGVKDVDARKIIREVAKPVSKWRTFATEHDITKRQIDRMASAFEHEDLQAAARL